MDQLISETTTAAPVEPIMRDISMDEIEAVSGGIIAEVVAAFGVGYAIGTWLYNHNVPGTHWV